MDAFFRYSKTFFLLTGTFVLCAFLSCMLPNQLIHKHIADSVPAFMEEGDYPRAIIRNQSCQMDNFTDALILDMAYYIDRDDLANSMFAPPYAARDRIMHTNLQLMVEGAITPQIYYSRYWHGATFLTRFLLVVGDYTMVRYFLYVLTSLLLLVTCCVLYRQAGLPLTVGFFSGFILLYGFVTQFSVQFATDIILSLLFVILVCWHHSRFEKVAWLLFVDGCVTCFLDLLTAPMLTVGMPMLVYILLTQRRHRDAEWRVCAKDVVVPSALWGVGYSLTWFSKWVLASIFTAEPAIRDGISQFLFRSGTDDGFSRWDALCSNVHMLPGTTLICWLVVLAIPAIVAFHAKNYKSVILLIPFAMLPYLWYLFAANHSYIHSWFTYRDQMLTVSALSVGLVMLADWSKIKVWCRIRSEKKHKSL